VKWKAGEGLDVPLEKYVEESKDVRVDMNDVDEFGAVRVNIAKGGGRELKHGQETLMVNASIMTLRYKPWNSPWVVDMDLERAD
jgi:hypothetical protein